jgi:Cupin-like domain
VEIGSSYLSEDYSQQLMSVEKFISIFIACPNHEHTQGIGYLAQHRLLDQVPLLLKDIATPDYCALLTEEDEVADADASSAGNSENAAEGADTVIVNAWLGPSTTVSPLHHDPYHNLLAQVVGYKYVRLYHPSASQFLYPMSDRMSNNR